MILCICLMVIPINVTALDLPDTNTSEITDETIVNGESIETEIIGDSTVTISPNDNSPEAQAIRKILEHKEANGETVETMAQQTGLIDGGIYNIKNYFSGKYLNVHYGVDANGTNVYQWTKDGSTEQKFKVVYDSDNYCYKIYAMCSSNGNNRVLDVVRNGSPLSFGQNVDIWTPVDYVAQELYLQYLIDGLYHIRMSCNPDLYFTTHDSLNGTSGGKSSTSAGNVYIRTFDVDLNQQWLFEYVGTSSSNPSTPVGSLETVNSSYIRGWAWRSDLPNTPINVNIQIYGVVNNIKYHDVTVSANQYDTDLYMNGYGNGYHEFTYYYDWSDMYSGTYKVYVYGIGANGVYTQLTASPKEYKVNNLVEAYCPRINQEMTKWCWAACAEMLGKNANPNATRTKYDVVAYLKGNEQDLYPNVGGFDEDIRIGAEYVSNNGTEFQVSTTITAQKIEEMINDGYVVALIYGEKSNSTASSGTDATQQNETGGEATMHAVAVYGYGEFLASNIWGYKDVFYYYDPSSTGKSYDYSELLNNAALGPFQYAVYIKEQ